jgi:RNA polymerase sigma-70 factor (ECF subfamily)
MRGNEAKLIEACRRGDRKAQEEFYKKYASLLLGVCFRYARNLEQAEDVLQEGFIRIFANLDQLKDPRVLKSWMTTIMVNTSITSISKNVKWKYEDIDIAEEVTVDEEVTSQLSVEDVMAAIQRLPDGFRIVLNLFAIEGYKHAEIAKKLGITESTSRSQYVRARRMLAGILKKANSVSERYEPAI